MRRRDAGFKVKRQSRRHVRAFLALSRAEQHSVLLRNEVWVYREDREREVDDNKVLQLLKGEEEEDLAEDECPTLEAAAGCNFEDEVDWDLSSEDEEEDKEAEEEKEEDKLLKGPLDAYPEPPPLKRLRTKGPGPRPLLELGWKAMIGVADYSSRVATELGCPVYCFAFKNTAYKPAAFRRWGVLAESADSIQFLSGRENGNFYYGARSLDRSPTAAWLLQNADSLETAYCRMPLIFSSLQKRTMGHIHCISEPEIKNAVGVDPRDGMAEMSLQLAQRLRLISAKLFLNDCYKPFQFRGLLDIANEPGTPTALCKGMAIINPGLQGEVFVLPKSTIKVRGPTLANRLSYGLDITTETRPMASPRLTASVLAMLETRVALVESRRERNRVERKLRSFVQKCKAHTWEVFKEKSFGIEPSPLTPIERQPLRRVAKPAPKDPWLERRADIHQIRLELAEGHEVPTPLEELLVEEEEVDPHRLSHKTREALGRGSVALWGNFKNHRYKPRLHIPAAGGHSHSPI